MIGLSNTKIGLALALETLKEFRRHITGAGVSNNLVNFIDPKTTEEEALVSQYLDIFAGQGASPRESEIQAIKDIYLSSLLDNTTGAYLMKDIIGGDPFTGSAEVTKAQGAGVKGSSANGATTLELSDYLLSLYEKIDNAELTSTLLTNDFDYTHSEALGVKAGDAASVIRLVTPSTAEYTSDLPDDMKDEDSFYEETTTDGKTVKKIRPNLNFATPENKPDKVFVNGSGPDKPPEDSNRLSTPGLGAFVIRAPELGFNSRNAEQLNLFFNAITPLEMSRCVPYINIAVVTLEDKNQPKNMSNVTFMRFIKKDGDGFALDENIGLKKAKPLGFEDIDTLFSSNMFEETVGRDVSLMDIFVSPQTMVNPDINNSVNELDGGLYGGRILDPFVPFLTLNSVSIDNAGMGAALFSSKVGSMSMTLHDRSRLADVSKLVAANQFGATKIILEFGWSHPEGSPDSENIIGRFLNSLRDRAVYTVKSSNFSFSDGNTVKIDLSLACFGSDETRSISAAAGAQVPLSTFSHAIEDIVQDMIKRSEAMAGAGSMEKSTFREVRHLLKVGQRNTTGTTALTTYENYKELVDTYSKIKSTPLSPLDPSAEKDRYLSFKSKLVNMLSATKIVGEGEDLSPDQLRAAIEQADIENTKNSTELLYGKINALTGGFSGDNASYNLDPFKRAVVDYKNPEDIDIEYEGQSSGKTTTVSLGKVLMSFVGHSLATSGLFDEVQMFFYPLNEKSGGARIHTTASLPITQATLREVFSKKLSRNPNLSIRSAFNLIEKKLVRDKSAAVYGVSSALSVYSKVKEETEAALKLIEEKASAESESGEVTAATKTKKQQLLDAVKLARDMREIDVRQAMTNLYSADGGPNCEPDLIVPNLSMYIETLPAHPSISSTPPSTKDATALDRWLAAEGADLSKTICRVHIYDEESTLRPQEALLNRLINEGSAGQAVVSGIGDSSKIATFVKPVTVDGKKKLGYTFEEALVNYVQKADAPVIKEAIKRGYPSITYGASTGVIKSISVSSNVSSQVSQVILVGSFARSDNPQDAGRANNGYDEVTVVPATITVEMLGMPLIQRGNEIFIDFGTSTTLDNIYVVKTVKHSISAGSFTTSVELVFSGQGKTSSVKKKIIEAISRV